MSDYGIITLPAVVLAHSLTSPFSLFPLDNSDGNKEVTIVLLDYGH